MTRTDGTSGCARRQHRVKEDGSVAVATSCARQDLLQTPCVGRSRKARVCETACAVGVSADDSHAPGHGVMCRSRRSTETSRGGGPPLVLHV